MMRADKLVYSQESCGSLKCGPRRCPSSDQHPAWVNERLLESVSSAWFRAIRYTRDIMLEAFGLWENLDMSIRFPG